MTQDDELTIESIFNEISPPGDKNVKQNILSTTTEKPKTTEKTTTVRSRSPTTTPDFSLEESYSVTPNKTSGHFFSAVLYHHILPL